MMDLDENKTYQVSCCAGSRTWDWSAESWPGMVGVQGGQMPEDPRGLKPSPRDSNLAATPRWTLTTVRLSA